MIFNKNLHIIIAMTFLSNIYQGICQTNVVGVILSGDDQSPLPGASVFLVNTTIGTSSGLDGKFTLPNVPNGKFLLAVTFVGYQDLTFEIPREGVNFYKVILKPDTNQLADIVVQAKRLQKSQWQNNLRLFNKYLIGEGENADHCRIVNPEVLQFDNTKKTISAKATEAIKIENLALGYLVEYHLTYFHFNTSTYRINYDGYPVFKELESESADQNRRWIEAREQAYKGSMMHFMRSFYKRTLVKEGFVLRRVEEEVNLKGERKLVADVGDTIVVYPKVFGKKNAEFYTQSYKSIMDTINSTLAKPLLAFDKVLEVRYLGEREPYKYQKARRDGSQVGYDRPQTSFLKLLSTSVAVQEDGQFFNSKNIFCEGYWTWELLGDALPLNFYPSNPTAIYSDSWFSIH